MTAAKLQASHLHSQWRALTEKVGVYKVRKLSETKTGYTPQQCSNKKLLKKKLHKSPSEISFHLNQQEYPFLSLNPMSYFLRTSLHHPFLHRLFFVSPSQFPKRKRKHKYECTRNGNLKNEKTKYFKSYIRFTLFPLQKEVLDTNTTTN